VLTVFDFVCLPVWLNGWLAGCLAGQLSASSLPRGKGLTPAITHSFVNRGKVQRTAHNQQMNHKPDGRFAHYSL